MPRPTFARIDLDALMHNAAAVKGLVGQRKICAAVKADAYGHGAPLVAAALRTAGVEMFAVATTEEAVELRDCGIGEPIILLTVVPSDDIETLLERSITSCIAEEGFAAELSKAALAHGVIAHAHVNVDTGMRRVGIYYTEAAEAIMRIARMPGIRLTGIFSHFSCSDAEDLSFSYEQLERFRYVIEKLRAAGMAVPFTHMANSCGVLRMPEAYFDGVRPGLIMYGLYPRKALRSVIHLTPVLSLHTAVAHCKRVPAGEKLGYGHTFTTWRESVIATLPIGYHDGFVRDYSNKGEVLIRGRRAPVVGRVCMDQTLVDVTDIPGVRQGDEVVIYGRQGGRTIRVEEMASLIGTIPYELTCAISRRVRRQFVLNGHVIAETSTHSTLPQAVLKEVFSHLAASREQTAPSEVAKRGAA